VSGAAFGHFLLGVGDGAFEGLDVVAFGLAALRHDLDAAGLNGLDVRVSLVPASYKPLPG
jgi:hypothetical protein